MNVQLDTAQVVRAQKPALETHVTDEAVRKRQSVLRLPP